MTQPRLHCEATATLLHNRELGDRPDSGSASGGACFFDPELVRGAAY